MKGNVLQKALLVVLCAFFPNGWAEYEAGIVAAKRGDFLTASREFMHGAKLGDPEAQAALSLVYKGTLPGLIQDDRKAMYWRQKAAEQGHAEAQLQLGRSYDFGRGVPEDDALSVKWYRKAAEQGNLEAQNNLGSQYYLGEGVRRDDALAEKWYRRSAEQGYSEAQFNLGAMYFGGQTVPKNLVYAYAWWRLAAEQGHQRSQQFLDTLTRKISNEEIKRAVRVSEKIQTQILEAKAKRPKNDLGSLVDSISRASDACPPVTDTARELHFKGFVILRPANGRWCPSDNLSLDEKDIARSTSAVFLNDDDVAYAVIHLVNLEERRFRTVEELVAFARKTKLAVEGPIGGTCNKCKFKYSAAEEAKGICSRYSIKGKGPGRLRRLSIGLLCVHPSKPSVLILAEFTKASLGKLNKTERSHWLNQGETFLSNFAPTKLE